MANQTNTRAPTSHIAPFGLRMQPELKEQLELAAQAAGRSLNSEIIARLVDSFTTEAAKNTPNLHVILDTDGKPICWDEIYGYLNLIRETGNLNVVSMSTTVITPDLQSSRDREQESFELPKKLRALKKSQK